MTHSFKFTLGAVTTAMLLAVGAANAATITITSRDGPGIGFNDPTPVAPVGGNTGTTLGQQRMNVYRAAADIWEANLTSPVTITVSAGWEALTCDAGSAVLGSAGAWNGWTFSGGGGVVPNTWYHQALANKLAGVDIPTAVGQEDDGTGYGNVDIKTQFNVNLGNANCLNGRFFYLGLDGNAGANVNFMATLLHELGHGLGFSVFTTSTANGSQFQGMPSIWEGFMRDNTTGKTWVQMTNAERTASAVNPLALSWNGPNTAVAAATVLNVPGGVGPARVVLSGPNAGASAGPILFGAAEFGPALGPTVAADVMPVVDQANGTGLACNPLTGANALAVNGRIALIDRGVCGFVVKVKNAQDAGAIGVLIADNAVAAISGLGGVDPTITIPAVRILKTTGDALKVRLATRSRTASGVTAAIGGAVATGLNKGMGAAGPLLYTPFPRIAGSSVSHWDVTASPNLLMEPNINADLTTILTAPKDLTVPLLKDLGW